MRFDAELFCQKNDLDPANYVGLTAIAGQYKGSPRLAYLEMLIGARGRINVSSVAEIKTTVHALY